MGYLGRVLGNKNVNKRHGKFLNFIPRGKLREAVIFFCKPELGGVLQPNGMVLDKPGIMEETVATVLVGKNLHRPPPPCSTLVLYDKMPIFIPMEITEDVVKSVAQKLSGSWGPGDTNLEAL